MKATEFAKTHSCDPDWIAIMGQAEIQLLKPGQTGTYVGLPATVARHYHNGMYEIHVPGGLTCVSGSEFVADQADLDVPVSAPMSEPDTNEPEADPAPAP